MKNIFLLFGVLFLIGCNNRDKLNDKGFQVEFDNVTEGSSNPNSIVTDSLEFKTKPVGVLLTGNHNIRISPLYKLNYDKKNKEYFTGNNDFYYNFNDNNQKGNYWENIIPGFEAVYGYNLVNVFHFDHSINKGHDFFDKPVLIKTCYYPSFEIDTLNFKPVSRNFYMISAFDEDTNKDKFINTKDLRRFYLFDANGENKEEIVPKDYSVTGATYDSANDFIYINASHDLNNNGKIDEIEPHSIFYLDLKNPENRGLFYKKN